MNDDTMNDDKRKDAANYINKGIKQLSVSVAGEATGLKNIDFLGQIPFKLSSKNLESVFGNAVFWINEQISEQIMDTYGKKYNDDGINFCHVYDDVARNLIVKDELND